MDKLEGCGCLIFIVVLFLILGADDPDVYIWLIGIGLFLIIGFLIYSIFGSAQHSSSDGDSITKNSSANSLNTGAASKKSISLSPSNPYENIYPSLPHNVNETLTVADELMFYYRRMENDDAFNDELSHHSIELNDEYGTPLLGKGADVRRLFFVDAIHCYAEMSDYIDLNRSSDVGFLYLISRLYDPQEKYGHEEKDLEYLHLTMYDTVQKYTTAVAAAPIYEKDDDADFMIALILLQYDYEEYQRYLTLLYRFCTLVAKADGQISRKEQLFLDHIIKLRGGELNNSTGGTVLTEFNPHNRENHYEQLQSLIGLESVKKDVITMSNFIKVQASRGRKGLKMSPISYHCVFTGNPGTGKTTVARILAGIYAELGVIKKGHLIETDRSGLIAEYEGQTAVKTNRVIDRALDGVLFIDEAYSLIGSGQDDYGKEAIATLLKRMEDNRDRLVVILAGYGDEMKCFIESNPGLQSRFNRYIHFPDYTSDELMQIFRLMTKKYDYELTPEAAIYLKESFTQMVENKDRHFGNARAVRNLFEKILEQQANRLSTFSQPTLSQLKEITVADCKVNPQI